MMINQTPDQGTGYEDNWYDRYMLNQLKSYSSVLEVPLTAIHMLLSEDQGYEALEVHQR